jgi:hypothetical protein
MMVFFNDKRLISGWVWVGVGPSINSSSHTNISSTPTSAASQMAFSLTHRRLLSTQSKPLNVLPVRPRPAPAAAARAAVLSTEQQQHAWQQALLEAMQEEYCKDAAESNPTLSCSTLEAYLDAVYDSLDEVLFSKVCVFVSAVP